MGITTKSQFRQGKNVESYLDEFFRARGWAIRPTSPQEERVQCLGDRVFCMGEMCYWIEYKSGIQTAYTGNVFLETVSVDTANKPGWVYTCQADYIFYAALLNDKILVFKPDRLRAHIEGLKQQFREVRTSHAQNNGYNTYGVIVPLAAAARLADKVIEL